MKNKLHSSAEAAASGVAFNSRAEIPDKYRWNLSDVFPEAAAFEKDFSRTEQAITAFAARRGTLAQSSGLLVETLRLHDELDADIEKLALYAGLSYHENMSVTATQGRSDRVQTLATRASEATSWLVPEILRIEPTTLARWIESEPGLHTYRHALEDIERQREHFLNDREEELLAMAGEIAAAPENIYSRFTNTNLDFPLIRDESGQEVRLSQAKYTAYIHSRDRRVRREAFIGLHETYQAKSNTLSAMLSAQVKKHIFFARARRFGTCLEAALHGPNIPTRVYDNLVSSVSRHVSGLHRYVAMRKKLMNLDSIHGYDLYAPLIEAGEERIPYDDAVETVVQSLRILGDDYVGVLREATGGRWIDVYETPNKRSGAYSWGIHRVHPYLLLNYNGTLHDRSTLAHELGHAMHSWYTGRAQPIVYGHYATFCAEVASTVNEVLLAHHLLENARNDRERLIILQEQIESIRTTVFRQTLFAEYERMIHQMAERGEPLTGEALCEAYAELVRKFYGPELVLDECGKAECLRIPHFYRNFYVYTYATSHCAAVQIGQRILDGDKGTIEGLKRFLSAGSSLYPLDVLRLAGVDLASPEPIEACMRLFDSLLRRFETLYSKV